MKIYQLIAYQSDIGCGSGDTILATTKNGDQLKSAAKKLNKEHGYSSDVDMLSFDVTEIDTATVQDSLTTKELEGLWN